MGKVTKAEARTVAKQYGLQVGFEDDRTEILHFRRTGQQGSLEVSLMTDGQMGCAVRAPGVNEVVCRESLAEAVEVGLAWLTLRAGW